MLCAGAACVNNHGLTNKGTPKGSASHQAVAINAPSLARKDHHNEYLNSSQGIYQNATSLQNKLEIHVLVMC